MIYLTRKEHFNAAHKLYCTAWTDEKNESVFGKCANKNWHGHNYELYVTVRGEVNAETGFLVNVKDLSLIIKSEVLDILDHKNLNLDVNLGDTILPSTENVAIWIWNKLAKQMPFPAVLYCVKLQETENIFVEYYGPNH